MKRALILLIVCSVSCLLVPGNALASDLYNNIGSTNDGADGVASWGPLADSFSTGPGGATVGQLSVLLMGDPGTGGSISLYLLSDNLTSPGSVLANFGTLSDSMLTGSLTVYSFTLASPYVLAPDTRYWIQIVGASSADWAWSYDQAAIGVAGEYFANAGGVWPNDHGPYQMQLSATTTPEPGTLLLLGGGLLSLLGVLRKK